MIKAILIGGLVVSLFTYFHNGGFQNRNGGNRRRPATRYGPPSISNETSTEPYFRIILGSNEGLKLTTKPPVSSTLAYENITTVGINVDVRIDTTPKINTIAMGKPVSFSTTTRTTTTTTLKSRSGLDETAKLVSNKSKTVPLNSSNVESRQSSSLAYETTTIRPANIITQLNTNKTKPTRTSTVTWATTLVEISSDKPPKETRRNSSTILAQENKTEPLELKTRQKLSASQITEKRLISTPATTTSTSPAPQPSILLAESTFAKLPKETTLRLEITEKQLTSTTPSTSPAPQSSTVLVDSTFAKLSKDMAEIMTSTVSSTTTIPQSSTLLSESTFAKLPNETSIKLSSKIAFENRTTPFPIPIPKSTSTAVLVESTKENYPVRKITTRPIAQILFEHTESSKSIETITEAAYYSEDYFENQDSRLRSRPVNHFIPPLPRYNFSEEIVTESTNSSAIIGNSNVAIPPAYYLPPRIRQFPVV